MDEAYEALMKYLPSGRAGSCGPGFLFLFLTLVLQPESVRSTEEGAPGNWTGNGRHCMAGGD